MSFDSRYRVNGLVRQRPDHRQGDGDFLGRHDDEHRRPLVANCCAIGKRPEPRCLALVAAVLVLGGVATGSRAEDLGTVGETYAIAEPHLLNYIEQTLREKEKSGELANLEEQAKQPCHRVDQEPQAAARDTAHPERARTFYFDPSIKVEQNITDDKGNIIVPAGTAKNPLEVVSLSKHLLFFDGSDPQQVRHARALIDHYGGKVKPILVAGSYLELMKRLATVGLLRPTGRAHPKFGITQVPALVSQEGMRLRIDELKCSADAACASHSGLARSRRDSRLAATGQCANVHGQVRQSHHRHLLVVRDAHLDWGGTRGDPRAGGHREPGQPDLHLSRAHRFASVSPSGSGSRRARST